MGIRFTVNNETADVTVDARTPLLWVLRETLGLTGTKFGCGMAQCGACTVLVDNLAVRACVAPIGSIAGAHVTTIEGLASPSIHPVQQAWMEEQVAQCGYCQPGQMMSATALLTAVPAPTDQDIDRALSGNICRCGTYVRIRRAVHRAAAAMKEPTR